MAVLAYPENNFIFLRNFSQYILYVFTLETTFDSPLFRQWTSTPNIFSSQYSMNLSSSILIISSYERIYISVMRKGVIGICYGMLRVYILQTQFVTDK